MAFLENLVDGMAVAKEKLSETAAAIQEKNKKLSQMRTLRNIMKRENDIMTQAYQSLGKIFYNKMSDRERKEYSFFCGVIENSKEKIENAHTMYVALQNGSNLEAGNEGTIPNEVTVACSNEEEYAKVSPKVSDAGKPKEKQAVSDDSDEVARKDLF